MTTREEIAAPRTDWHVREQFARERRRYEKAVVARFGGALSREDAEDIVSDAIINLAGRCPVDARDEGRAWFMRVVLNRAQDFRRAREGRPRSTRGGAQNTTTTPGVLRRFVPWDDPMLTDAPADRTVSVEEHLEREADRREAEDIVRAAFALLTPQQAELLRRRHLVEDRLPRQQVAADLGLTLSSYENLYTGAWRAFRFAVRKVMHGEHDVGTH